MAKAKVMSVDVLISLEISDKEARYLKDLLRNYLGDDTLEETHAEMEYRINLYNAIDEALKTL